MYRTKPDKEQFTILLKQAVEKLCQTTGKRFYVVKQELANEIGRKVFTIEYWERADNNTLPKQSELEGLAEAIFRQLLDEQWLDAFLFHGRHPAADSFRDCLLKKVGRTQPLPRADFFVGRAQYLNAIFAELERPNGHTIIAIDGMGGIGKTAVAAKVHDYYTNAVFDHVIWISADRSDLPFFLKEQHPFNFEMILNSIGQHFGEQGMPEMPLRQKAKRVYALLQTHRCLIILDNVETAVMPQHEIVAWIRPFLNPSRLLITSRRRFSGNLFQIHLQGLQQQNAFELITHWGKEKSISHILQRESDSLSRIYQVTGGSPLAIKLVVSLLQHVPLETAINHLETAVPLDRVPAEDEYVNCYRDIFMQVWQMLGEDDTRLLTELAGLDRTEGISVTMIAHIIKFPLAHIANMIQYLWRLSLLEVHDQAQSKEILYFLQPLTRYFVLSDMANGTAFM